MSVSTNWRPPGGPGTGGAAAAAAAAPAAGGGAPGGGGWGGGTPAASAIMEKRGVFFGPEGVQFRVRGRRRRTQNNTWATL